MGDDNGLGIIWAAALIAGLFLGMLIGVYIERWSWHKKAIESGYAEYNSKTGDWQWIDYEYKARIVEETP